MLLTDDHLYRIVTCCPHLQEAHFSGLFSDKGLIHLATYCHDLRSLSIVLPNSLIQSNTITHVSIERLAQSCPQLTHFTCLGQTRIDPLRSEATFRTHCPSFIFCNFGDPL
ncbi:uncharacterized protein BX664DRAFT_253714 [Halteromyces radiatus]|uniref:uncharacterized protein n=1 Tax=Halteromyces radiatus TaxID=101107 RepID=UPI00221F03B6|nr:uncharacterized protein BX664DRAFT_253714 [Halteromyces radiatus]KAI8099655.1 hypothetical protein BX664DRAFT_253714 [Halteromyces radiatus]